MGASRYLSIRAGALAHRRDRGYIEPFYHATYTFSAFIIFGFMPLISFLIPNVSDNRFLISCIITAIILFMVGSLRVFISTKHWIRGGIELLLIGGAAAIVAFAVGHFSAGLIAS